MWDPQQYAKFADHRSRPFGELVSRVAAESPRLVYDLGCGSGQLTATLSERWPMARIVGVDNDPAMLARTSRHATKQLSFVEGDLNTFVPPAGADIVISNAAYQWVDDNPARLRAIAAQLPADGWLAVQVPGNFAAPSHTLLRELLAEPRWAEATNHLQLRESPVLDAAGYGELFASEGLVVDTWETVYNQVLTGEDPVLEWVKGSALRPVLDVLSQADAEGFIADLRPRLREAYPATTAGTVYGFRRVFAVGHRPA